MEIKMRVIVIESKWDKFSQNVLNWWKKRRNNPFIKENRVRERSISILQKRYGYTKEQATSELDKHYSKAWLG
jgi:hypothetical protein